MTLRSRLKETFGIAEVDPETRHTAIAATGPTWSEWGKGPFAKAYLALGFFIGDCLVGITGLQPPDPLVGVAVIGLLFLEFVGWQYLWHRPNLDRESRSGTFHPTFYRPFRFGRWTPEGERAQGGVDPFGNARVGPDPDEFL